MIDPTTFRVIATYPTGHEPQHVVPSWDLKTLWVNDDIGNDMVPIDPITVDLAGGSWSMTPTTCTSPPMVLMPS